MATNPWISQSVRNEQNLYEDLVIESLKFYGQDVYYLPREIVNKDKVFLDDVPSRFSDSYKIEMYVENIDGFEGEGDLLSKFGVELRDQATFVVARRRWKNLIGDKLDSYNFRPREGDLLYIPFSQSIFEIFKVETETPFYQLNQLPTFRLQCELFEYNDEDFDTDIEGIDDVEVESAFQYKLQMASPETATAQAYADVDDNGRVQIIRFDNAGFGYTTPPTVTIEQNPGSNSKFGNGSLNVSRGRGIETSYLLTNPTGYAEMWVYVNNLPSAGNRSALFLTGGTETNLERKYMWGIDNAGKLIYSRGDNLGGGIVTPADGQIFFQPNTWHHLIIGADDTNTLYIYFDNTLVTESQLAGVTWDFISSDGFSVRGHAARSLDGIQWNVLDGFIDEFRVRIGSKSDLLTSRYIGGQDITLVEQEEEWDSDANTAYLNHFNPGNATAIVTINDEGQIQSSEVTNTGIYYENDPTVTIAAPYSGGNYQRGDIVTQDQGDFSMKGEVAKWSDSDNILYLVHVGATDGKYHTFNTKNAVVSDNATYAPSLVEELQQIQQVDTGVAQNTYFDDFEGDFLDFSENNPFGDIS